MGQLFIRLISCSSILLQEVRAMTLQIGFNSEKYLAQQTTAIKQQVDRFGNKLYLEFVKAAV